MSNLLNTENNNLSDVPTVTEMMLSQLLSEVSKLRKLTEQTNYDLQAVKEKQDQFIASTNTFIASTNTFIDDTKKQLNSIKTNQQQLQTSVSKVDNIHEMIARKELRELRGVDYARSFEVTDLLGLARLSFPKDPR